MSLDAMKQALAALENSRSYVEFDWVKNQCGRAITALSAAIEQAEARTIKTWRQRCEEHPDHDGIVSEGMIQARMQEEIDELRAKRQWQGLTDDEIEEVGHLRMLPYSFARAIEAKLRDKNA